MLRTFVLKKARRESGALFCWRCFGFAGFDNSRQEERAPRRSHFMPESPDPKPAGFARPFSAVRRPATIAGAALLVALVYWIYWPAIHGTWLWDDRYEIADNVLLRDPAGLARIWRGELAVSYYPVKATLQWLLFRIWGADVTGFHAVSIGLHALSALLLWGILRRLGLKQAWIGGFLFAVHPLAVESVAWMAELKNTLSLFLALLSFRAFIGYDDTRRRSDWITALLLFIAAMLSKTAVVTFPAVLLLLTWWRHGKVNRRDVIAVVPFFIVSAALGCVTVWFEHVRAIGDVPLDAGSAAVRVARAGLAVIFYAWKCAWPVDLMPVYPRWAIEPTGWGRFMPWIALAALAGLLCRHRTRAARHALFGAAVFGLNLLPILGFVSLGYLHAGWVADHFAYLSLTAFAGLAAGAIGSLCDQLSARQAQLAKCTVVAVILLLAARSRMYAAHFRSAEDLWTYGVARNPASSVAHNNLGNVHFAAGHAAAAAREFSRAVELEPANVGMHINHGNALGRLGDAAGALREHRMAVALAPNASIAVNSLGGSLLDAGRVAEARATIERALALDPLMAEAHNNLGIAFATTGELNSAEREFARAVALKPDLAAAVVNLNRVRQQIHSANK